jgi:RNA polymerase sigma-70 factor (ECF subfamily)
VPAVNSALQRARVALDPAASAAAASGPLDPERVDVEALAALVADDVVLEMPPVRAWSRGRRSYHEFMDHLFTWRGTEWQTRLVGANGQSPLLLYLLTPRDRLRTLSNCST